MIIPEKQLLAEHAKLGEGGHEQSDPEAINSTDVR
jgi:hypothetical protein